VLDVDFIAGHTNGFEALRDDLRATTWEAIEGALGMSRPDLQSAARAYVEAESAVLVYGMGITQHRRGTENVRLITNLALLRGNIGRPGAGLCPVRGHSNVQGNRTVGITEKPTTQFLDRLRDAFGFEPPREHGRDVVGAIEAMGRGDAKAFIGLGGNFAAAAPDTAATFSAMRKLDLTVQIATKLNRSHLSTAAKPSSCPASDAPRSTIRRPDPSRSRSRIRCRWSMPPRAGTHPHRNI
jgi:anaerobic selenocysteine-containing dehydrogenase